MLNTPSLIQDLAIYSEEHQREGLAESRDPPVEQLSALQSALFLRISAAADYYTTDRHLMQHPSLVDVDISMHCPLIIIVPANNDSLVLDPYLLNIFPQSLLPTAGYIILLAAAGWYISQFAWKKLEQVINAKEHAD